MKKYQMSAAVFFAACASYGGAECGGALHAIDSGLDCASQAVVSVQNAASETTAFTPFFDYYAVLLSNPYGGAGQATNYTHEMIFGATGDLDKILGWRGAKLTVSGAYNAGGNLSDTIGNFFTVSESFVTDGVMFYQFFLEQKIDFGGDWANFKIGRISMGGQFDTIPVFGSLTSGAFDSNPASVFSNSPFTSSPIATWGAIASYNTADNLSFSAGLFQIPQNVQSPKWSGTDWGISSDDGYMAVFQTTWSPTLFDDGNGGLNGTYQAGVWFFGGFDMQYLDGSGESRGNGYGFYLQGQQQIWVDENNADKYVALFGGAQIAPITSIAAMPLMVYGGFHLQGFVPCRKNDGFYAAVACGWFSSELDKVQEATYETAIEITYVIQINQHISIQPDFQYIMRPYGNTEIDDALVVGGQLLVTF